MGYVAWLKRRKTTGSRPLRKRDGRYTSPEVEAALWRSVMSFLHDAENGEEDDEEEEEEDEEVDPLQEALGEEAGEGPELIPDAGAGVGSVSPSGPMRTAGAVAGGALSAMATGVVAAVSGALPAAVPALTDGRVGPSGPPSTAGSVPGTAESLQAELRELYRPDQEPVADYMNRMARIAEAHGVSVTAGELAMLTTKATLLAEEFAQVGGDWHPTRMVRRLRSRFAVAALMQGGW
ncbi:pol [Symbiodinium sp. CCMP2592]|nr:pol [Symbiodinium sp. CCMP2592]